MQRPFIITSRVKMKSRSGRRFLPRLINRLNVREVDPADLAVAKVAEEVSRVVGLRKMVADLRVAGHDQVEQVAQRAAGRATVDEQVTVIAGGVHEEIDGVFAGAGVEVHHRRSRLALNIESVCRAAAVDGEPCQFAVDQSAARTAEMIALGGPDLAGG